MLTLQNIFVSVSHCKKTNNDLHSTSFYHVWRRIVASVVLHCTCDRRNDWHSISANHWSIRRAERSAETDARIYLGDVFLVPGGVLGKRDSRVSILSVQLAVAVDLRTRAAAANAWFRSTVSETVHSVLAEIASRAAGAEAVYGTVARNRASEYYGWSEKRRIKLAFFLRYFLYLFHFTPIVAADDE